MKIKIDGLLNPNLTVTETIQETVFFIVNYAGIVTDVLQPNQIIAISSDVIVKIKAGEPAYENMILKLASIIKELYYAGNEDFLGHLKEIAEFNYYKTLVQGTADGLVAAVKLLRGALNLMKKNYSDYLETSFVASDETEGLSAEEMEIVREDFEVHAVDIEAFCNNLSTSLTRGMDRGFFVEAYKKLYALGGKADEQFIADNFYRALDNETANYKQGQYNHLDARDKRIKGKIEYSSAVNFSDILKPAGFGNIEVQPPFAGSDIGTPVLKVVLPTSSALKNCIFTLLSFSQNYRKITKDVFVKEKVRAGEAEESSLSLSSPRLVGGLKKLFGISQPKPTGFTVGTPRQPQDETTKDTTKMRRVISGDQLSEGYALGFCGAVASVYDTAGQAFEELIAEEGRKHRIFAREIYANLLKENHPDSNFWLKVFSEVFLDGYSRHALERIGEYYWKIKDVYGPDYPDLEFLFELVMNRRTFVVRTAKEAVEGVFQKDLSDIIRQLQDFIKNLSDTLPNSDMSRKAVKLLSLLNELRKVEDLYKEEQANPSSYDMVKRITEAYNKIPDRKYDIYKSFAGIKKDFKKLFSEKISLAKVTKSHVRLKEKARQHNVSQFLDKELDKLRAIFDSLTGLKSSEGQKNVLFRLEDFLSEAYEMDLTKEVIAKRVQVEMDYLIISIAKDNKELLRPDNEKALPFLTMLKENVSIVEKIKSMAKSKEES